VSGCKRGLACHPEVWFVILSVSEESRCPGREILRFAQDDKEGHAQDDKEGHAQNDAGAPIRLFLPALIVQYVGMHGVERTRLGLFVI
jgi:hypothetical protein